MNSNLFGAPQRQSQIGVLLIFLTKIFNLLKGFWAIIIYFLFTGPSISTIIYISLGLGGATILILIYSFVYYRRFLFHIDYAKQEFILEKGVFNKENIAIPFDRIQQVYIKRSILQRILDVSSFVIETAGSKEEEININAISNERANQLLGILIEVRDKYSVNITEAEMSKNSNQNQDWSHKLSFLSLLKIGISTNYLRGLVLMSAFFATIYNELRTVSEEYSDTLQEYLSELSGPLESVSIFMLIAFFVLLLSILITIAEVFIKYFNLKLTQTKDSLELEMGLNTNTKVSLKPKRVQMLQVITNPVQKWLNLYQVRISLANSENDLQKSKIKIPGLDEDTVSKVNSFLYSNRSSNIERSFSPNRVLLIRYLLLLLIPALVSYLTVVFIDAISIKIWLLFIGLYSIIGVIWQILMFRSLKLIITEEFVYKKYGVWSKIEERFEIYKIQSISISQPLWYKKRNLANIVFHTAGGDIPFRAVNNNILPYINYMFYKVETNSSSWM
ncbi:putative membrane protein [Gillisia mitskevichiae]|uniref:Putative membrane protein n=1 Tax=Gillisia mitskevichiae TaxID=270921 RepID=A0A495PME9_9FLAO|nr:PH domain-containing protein [Gillisia mitskevichiae]RKS50648.1 putative membrane protein [Gillisia mitskevichiae]